MKVENQWKSHEYSIPSAESIQLCDKGHTWRLRISGNPMSTLCLVLKVFNCARVTDDERANVISYLRKRANHQLERHRIRFGEEDVCDSQPIRCSSVCYFPDAIIIPGTQQYDIHIAMHELSFLWIVKKQLRSNFLMFWFSVADIPITSCCDVI